MVAANHLTIKLGSSRGRAPNGATGRMDQSTPLRGGALLDGPSRGGRGERPHRPWICTPVMSPHPLPGGSTLGRGIPGCIEEGSAVSLTLSTSKMAPEYRTGVTRRAAATCLMAHCYMGVVSEGAANAANRTKIWTPQMRRAPS